MEPDNGLEANKKWSVSFLSIQERLVADWIVLGWIVLGWVVLGWMSGSWMRGSRMEIRHVFSVLQGLGQG